MPADVAVLARRVAHHQRVVRHVARYHGAGRDEAIATQRGSAHDGGVGADGRPASRHTYDGLAYLPDRDEMFSLGGSGIPCGYAVPGTWTLDLAAVSSAPPGQAAPWTQHKPAPYPAKASFGVVADYDPNGKRVIVNDTYSLWAFDPNSHAYTLLNDSNKTGAHIDYHMTGRVDPKRKLFVVVGGFLVGFGTRYAGGCTSGHTIYGLSTLQWPSLVASIGFMVGGILCTHFLLPVLLAL